MLDVSARGNGPDIDDGLTLDNIEDIVEIDRGVDMRRKQRDTIADRDRRFGGSEIVACSSLSDVTVAQSIPRTTGTP